ncbi:hypothetical protein BH11ACT3_BH11ACT3_16170 [soil metagenome]
MTDAPVAGWYPDPDSPAQDRWWDGTAWSEHRRAHSADVAAPAPALVAAPPVAAPNPYTPSPNVAAYGPGVPLGYAPVVSTPPVKNTMAIVGLVVGILGVPLIFVGFSFFSILIGVTGGILSTVAFGRAKRMIAAGLGETARRSIAITGMVIGWGGAVAALGWTVLVIVQFFVSF